MKNCRIATIPGDSIGKEVIPAGRELLEALVPCTEGRASSGSDTLTRMPRRRNSTAACRS
jgi:isocitrate/isopropylmalate dehydrogenase